MKMKDFRKQPPQWTVMLPEKPTETTVVLWEVHLQVLFILLSFFFYIFKLQQHRKTKKRSSVSL